MNGTPTTRGALYLTAALLGCGSSAVPAGSSTPTPQQDCQATVMALANAAVRCDPSTTYATAYAAIERNVSGGQTCAAIIAVRDRNSLRNTCIPSLARATCADLMMGRLDPTCAMQLQRRS